MPDSGDELRTFIRSAMNQGASDRFLADVLKSQGWSERAVHRAFLQHFEEATGQRVPVRREAGESARDAFYHLLVFSTLASWTIALGSLLFTLIHRAFPDPLRYRDSVFPYNRTTIATEVATLLVAFPVFLWVSRTVAAERQKANSAIRRWLTYLALFVAAGVVIGDGIAVLAYFLRGELTSRFLLKVLVLLVIAGGVFAYYSGEVRADPEPKVDSRRRRAFGLASALVVMLAVALGFLTAGSPESQRMRQADLERVRNLRQIAEEIHRTRRAPDTRTLGITDPVTNTPYEYRAGEGTSYELCAEFATDTRAELEAYRIHSFWEHPKGRHCFQLDAAQPPADLRLH